MIDAARLAHGLVVYIHLQQRVYQAVASAPRKPSSPIPFDAWTFLVRGGRRITPEQRHVYATPLEALRARGDGMVIDQLTTDEKRAWSAIPEPMPGPNATRDECDAFLASKGFEFAARNPGGER